MFQSLLLLHPLDLGNSTGISHCDYSVLSKDGCLFSLHTLNDSGSEQHFLTKGISQITVTWVAGVMKL